MYTGCKLWKESYAGGPLRILRIQPLLPHLEFCGLSRPGSCPGLVTMPWDAFHFSSAGDPFERFPEMPESPVSFRDT